MSEVVYFIQAGNSGPIKIGYCSSEAGMAVRLMDLQCGNPAKLVVRRVVPGNRALEKDLHRRFGQWRLEGEWFANVIEVAKVAHCPDMGNRDPLRRALPWVRRAYEAGRRVGRAEMERELHDAIKGELLVLAERWWPEPEDDVEGADRGRCGSGCTVRPGRGGGTMTTAFREGFLGARQHLDSNRGGRPLDLQAETLGSNLSGPSLGRSRAATRSDAQRGSGAANRPDPVLGRHSWPGADDSRSTATAAALDSRSDRTPSPGEVPARGGTA